MAKTRGVVEIIQRVDPIASERALERVTEMVLLRLQHQNVAKTPDKMNTEGARGCGPAPTVVPLPRCIKRNYPPSSGGASGQVGLYVSGLGLLEVRTKRCDSPEPRTLPKVLRSSFKPP